MMEGSDWEIKEGNECAKKLKAVNSALNTLLAYLQSLSAGLDGRIDGHSWGAEHTGKNKVTIADLEEIKEEIDNIINKYKNG